MTKKTEQHQILKLVFLQVERIYRTTDLHSFTTATPRSSITLMWRTILLHPKGMCPILNKTSWICRNLEELNYAYTLSLVQPGNKILGKI